MLLSICKEITYLASVYPSISIMFLKAPINVGFQHLSSLPPGLCVLQSSDRKFHLCYGHLLSCAFIQVETCWLFFMDFVFLFFFLSAVFPECKIKVRLVETFSLAARRSRHDLQCITVSWWHRTAHFCNYAQYQQRVRILTDSFPIQTSYLWLRKFH